MNAIDRPISTAGWTRARYRKAHHLSRLLSRLTGYGSAPPLVEKYAALWSAWNWQHEWGIDPLHISARQRLALKRDEVPF